MWGTWWRRGTGENGASPTVLNLQSHIQRWGDRRSLRESECGGGQRGCIQRCGQRSARQTSVWCRERGEGGDWVSEQRLPKACKLFLNINFFLFFLICICVCIYVGMWMWGQCLQWPEESDRSPRAGVRGGSEQLDTADRHCTQVLCSVVSTCP